MKMARFLLLIVTLIGIASAQTGSRGQRASTGAFIGNVNGQTYGGTYHAPDDGPPVVNRFGNPPPQSSFNGNPTYAPNFPFVPPVPQFANPFDVNVFFQNYFKDLNENLASNGVQQNKIPLRSSSSSVAISFDGSPTENNGVFKKNFEFQKTAFEAAQNAFQTTANRFGPGFYGPNFQYGSAAAGASFGPGGGHQFAGVFPENPANPNVNTRFGSSGPNKSGTFGVASSSFSSSSNVGGKKTNYKEASTTINDNGKVSTYTVRS